MKEKVTLLAAQALTAGLWLLKISFALKILVTTVAGFTTILAFFNQYKTFEKNYRTMWIVVIINQWIPKRKRHRGINISRKKPTTEHEADKN